MKAIIVLMVVGALALVAVYQFGGTATFDPSQQGKDAKAAIGPGMSWQAVFAVANEPREYEPIFRRVKRIGNQEIEYFEPGVANKFDRADLADRIANNRLPYGFICTFEYSTSVAFFVTFDGTGTVVGIDDAPTMATLLQLDDD